MKHSVYCSGKTVECILENGNEVAFQFTDGTTARFQWLDDDGNPVKGKLRCVSLGTHIRAKSVRLGMQVPQP